MIEEFDANQSTDLVTALALLASMLLIGLLLEIALLRVLRKRAQDTHWFLGKVLFTSLSGQPLYWIIVGGTFFTAPILSNRFPIFDVIRTTLIFTIPLALTILVVRIGLSWVVFYFENQQIGSVSLINNTMRFLGLLVISATLLALLGVPIGPLLTVVAGSSLGLTLALREPLANLFAGMVIIASSKVHLGDYVRLASGEEGYITDIRWSDTSIMSTMNHVVVVPNSQLTSSLVINFNRPDPEVIILFDFFVGYDNDLQAIEAAATEVATEVVTELDGGVSDYTPLIRFNAFQDSSIRFTVVLRGKTYVDQYLLKHELSKRMHARLLAEGVTLPYPVRVVHVPRPINVENDYGPPDSTPIERYD